MMIATKEMKGKEDSGRGTAVVYKQKLGNRTCGCGCGYLS